MSSIEKSLLSISYLNKPFFFGLFSNYYWKQHILYTHGLGFSDWSGSGSSLLPDLGTPPMTSLPPSTLIASLMLMLWAFRLVWAEYAVCRWESRASGGHKARQRVYPAWEYCPVKDCRAEYRRQICRRRGRYPVRRALSVGRVQLRITLSVAFSCASAVFWGFDLKNKYSRNSLNFRSIFLLVFSDPAGIRTQDPKH